MNSAAIKVLLVAISMPLIGLAGPAATLVTAPATKMQEGDAAYKQRGDESKARKALTVYRELFRAYPQDPEVGWRLGMACYFVGLRLTKSNDEKEKIFAEGRDAAMAAAKLNSKCAPCHFWSAINSALYGDTAGVAKMMFSINTIQDHLDQSIAADKNYAYGGAYRLKGLIAQKLPWFFGGSTSDAKKFFQKAIDVAPDEPLNYLFMARLMADEGEKEEGLKWAKKGLQVDPPAPERLEAKEALQDLKDFISQNEKKKPAEG